MAPTKKIMFVTPSLKGGGAEHIACSMASYWAEQGKHITIVTLAGPHVEPDYVLSDKVKLISLDVMGKSINALVDNLNRVKLLRRTIKNVAPDRIISLMESTNVLSILASAGLRCPVTVVDCIDPEFYSYGRIWRALRNVLYVFSDSFVVQTKGVLDHYPSYLAKCATVIPNFVEIKAATGFGEVKEDMICAMGRLHEQKGFDVLVKAFAKIKDDFPEWKLTIWGKGEEKNNLLQLSKELGVSERILFPGFTKQPEKALARCKIFVLSSRYEGLPNVLLMAMTCGLPVISTDCPCGPGEIIETGKDGILAPVDDADALSESMRRLISDERLRQNLGDNAAKKMRDCYSIEYISNLWEKLLSGGK